MRMAREIEPRFFFEANSINDQAVTIPLADRISEPRRFALFGERLAIRENLPVVVVSLKDQDDQAPLLNDLPRRGVTISIRHAVRETTPIRPIFAVVGLAFLVKLFVPRLHQDFNAVSTEINEIFRVRPSPDPRQIRRTIGQPRRGRGSAFRQPFAEYADRDSLPIAHWLERSSRSDRRLFQEREFMVTRGATERVP